MVLVENFALLGRNRLSVEEKRLFLALITHSVKSPLENPAGKVIPGTPG